MSVWVSEHCLVKVDNNGRPGWLLPLISMTERDGKEETDAMLCTWTLNWRANSAFGTIFSLFSTHYFSYRGGSVEWTLNIRRVKPSPPSPKDKFFFSVDKSDVGRTAFVKYGGREKQIWKVTFKIEKGVICLLHCRYLAKLRPMSRTGSQWLSHYSRLIFVLSPSRTGLSYVLGVLELPVAPRRPISQP